MVLVMNGPRLIVVAPDGVLRYQSRNISDCRRWLRDYLGMSCTLVGWHKTGWRGAIYFAGENWHAGAWPTGEQQATAAVIRRNIPIREVRT